MLIAPALRVEQGIIPLSRTCGCQAAQAGITGIAGCARVVLDETCDTLLQAANAIAARIAGDDTVHQIDTAEPILKESGEAENPATSSRAVVGNCRMAEARYTVEPYIDAAAFAALGGVAANSGVFNCRITRCIHATRHRLARCCLVIVLRLMVKPWPMAKNTIPPPSPDAELPLMILLVIVSGVRARPTFIAPPFPSPMLSLFLPIAELLLKTLPLMLILPPVPQAL